MNNYTSLRIKETTTFIFIMIILVAGALLFREWILSQNYLAENSFLNNMNEAYKSFLVFMRGNNPPQNIVMNYTLPFLMFFMTLSVISILSLVVVLIIRRVYRKYKMKKIIKNVDTIQDLILDYLFDPDSVTFETLKGENKKLLVDQMMLLYKFIIGAKALQLKKLFKDLRLDNYVAKKIKSVFWKNRLKYLQVATAMDLVPLLYLAKKNINSTNWHVRDAAQLASLQLDKKYSFDFLSRVHRKISEWQETQIYHLIVKESIPVDNFSKYLTSKNDSVIIFSLKLMEDFQQRDHDEKIIELLAHKNYHVKKQAMKAIIGLNIKSAEKTILKNYSKERTSVKILMMKALSKFNSRESLDFIISQLPHEKFDINMAGLAGLNADARAEVLNKITWNNDIEQISKHISNKQLV